MPLCATEYERPGWCRLKLRDWPIPPALICLSLLRMHGGLFGASTQAICVDFGKDVLEGWGDPNKDQTFSRSLILLPHPHCFLALLAVIDIRFVFLIYYL